MKRRVTILVAGIVAASLPWLARNYATRKQESLIPAVSEQDGEVMFSHDGGSLCLEAPENSDSVLIYDGDIQLPSSYKRISHGSQGRNTGKNTSQLGNRTRGCPTAFKGFLACVLGFFIGIPGAVMLVSHTVFATWTKRRLMACLASLMGFVIVFNFGLWLLVP